MCLLKACPATRCTYICTVNPHWIHVSRGVLLWNEITSRLQNHHVVRCPTDGQLSWWKNTLELLSWGGEKTRAEVIQVWFGSCVRVRECVGCAYRPWVRQSCFTSEEELLLCAAAPVSGSHQDWLVVCVIPANFQPFGIEMSSPCWLITCQNDGW